MMTVDDAGEELKDKDDWPDPPPKAVPGYPTRSWSDHVVAFLGKGSAAVRPTVTVVSYRTGNRP